MPNEGQAACTSRITQFMRSVYNLLMHEGHSKIPGRLLALLAAIALSCSLALCLGCSGNPQQDPDPGQQPIEQPGDPGSGQQGGTDVGGEPSTGGDVDKPAETVKPAEKPVKPAEPAIDENGSYTSKDDVALYIHIYGHLPKNYISKTKARDKGWVASKGNLDEVCPGKSIGGSRFYNDDGQLPDKKGRYWTECDIDYHGGYRGEKRIVFSNDGLIFYTGDHYETFEQLY